MNDETATGGATPPEPEPGASAKPAGSDPDGVTPTGEGKGGNTPDTSSTQDEALTSAITKERDARREAERRAAQLRDRVTELEDAGKSEVERTQGALKRATDELAKSTARVTELEGELQRRDLDTLKAQVAAEFELPVSVAKRLQGSNARELRADAKSLSEEIGSGGRTATIGVGRGGAASGTRRVDMNSLIREAAGRKG